MFTVTFTQKFTFTFTKLNFVKRRSETNKCTIDKIGPSHNYTLYCTCLPTRIVVIVIGARRPFLDTVGVA